MEKQALAAQVLAALGGAKNLSKLTYCASRIRVELVDSSRLDEQGLAPLGAIKAFLAVETARHTTEYHLVVGPGNSRSLYEALTQLTAQP